MRQFWPNTQALARSPPGQKGRSFWWEVVAALVLGGSSVSGGAVTFSIAALPVDRATLCAARERTLLCNSLGGATLAVRVAMRLTVGARLSSVQAWRRPFRLVRERSCRWNRRWSRSRRADCRARRWLER